MQSARSVNQSVQVPGLDSEEMRTIQAVLGVLSIYWKPLQRLVRLPTILYPKASYSSGFTSVFIYVPKANTKKAIKLHKAIDADQSNDANLITSPPYVYNTRRPRYPLEPLKDHGDTTSVPSN